MLDSAERQNAAHDFHAAVDADYDIHYGVDGALILDVSHGSEALDLTPQRIQEWMDNVPGISTPSVCLLARVP